MTTSTSSNRPASSPMPAAVQGTTAAGIGQLVASLFLAANPELILVAPVVGTAVSGVLSGVGAAARDRLHRDATGPIGLIARLFSWLG